jgi:hypothetical protein
MSVKFRAWDTVENNMIDWVTLSQTAFNNGNGAQLLYTVLVRMSVRYVKMLITGLEDVKGRYIYDGDIIQSSFSDGKECTHLIFWDDQTCSFKARYIEMNSFVKCESSISQNWINEFGKEIIGNKFENPELLQGIA